MFIRTMLLGLTSGIMAGIACMVFAWVYSSQLYLDFSPLIGPVNYFGACIFGCVLASLGYWVLRRFIPKLGGIIFNLLFTVLTFASILGPVAYTWPLDADQDLITYFPMFAMTLHFFPAIVWYTLKPLFVK